MKRLKQLIKQYKKRKYYEQRAERWAYFKKQNPNLKCGLTKNSKWIYERYCHNCSYDNDFFEKYGCMYVKGFENL